MKIVRCLMSAVVLAAVSGSALAQHDHHDAADHGMAHDEMSDMGDGAQTSTPSHEGHTMDHSSHEMAPAAEHHGDHVMSHDAVGEASAEEDLRDPDAYSAGYDFTSRSRPVMADEHYFAGLLVDRLEHADAENSSFITYDLKTWLGRDYDRLVLEAEGDVDGGKVEESATELLWSHAVASFWNARLGARVDTGEGPDRSWLAAGFEGLAPYWFEVDATFYVGENSRTAFAVEAEYELLLTQKLVLQPRLEAEFFGKSDPERELGSGLSEASAGLRLRYEFVREFAPYVGIEWAGKFGGTADYARDANVDPRETRVVGGVRFWL